LIVRANSVFAPVGHAQKPIHDLVVSEPNGGLLQFVSRGKKDAAQEIHMQGFVRNAGSIVACCLLAAATFGHAQAAPAKPAVGTVMTPAATYGKLLGMLSKEFADAADAMPEDKFNFAPTQGEFKGVRSFGDQVKHVAEANWYFFGGSMSEADSKAKHDAIEKLTSKADIVKALQDSLTQAKTFVDGITAENAFVMTYNGTRGGMASFGIAHMMDHYGQLVVYLRMNGIVPPASRNPM
jgi:uncharacterized damage-inducible protein DinB